MTQQRRWQTLGIGIALLATVLLCLLVIGTPSPRRVLAASAVQADNAACLTCHSNKDLNKTLPSGEIISLFIDEKKFQAAVHGKATCQSCHTDITGYPHPAFVVSDRRDAVLKLYTNCRQCHQEQYTKTLDSIHAKAMAAGERYAPVCTDCHTAHEVTSPHTPRTHITQTCEKCHSPIYNEYKNSIHGAALIGEGNPDVPTCVDCHGVHNVGDPRTAAFRLKSPEICAKCHTDKKIMAKYKLSTNVLNTYVADFHGTTISIFEKQSPDAPSNKAVCYDCHGIHNILQIDDPHSTVFKQNLLKTCEQCHPDATTNSFVGSWMSHYDASATKYPLVYYINLFYKILIPAVIGAMLIFIGIDAMSRLVGRFGRRPTRHDEG